MAQRDTMLNFVFTRITVASGKKDTTDDLSEDFAFLRDSYAVKQMLWSGLDYLLDENWSGITSRLLFANILTSDDCSEAALISLL